MEERIEYGQIRILVSLATLYVTLVSLMVGKSFSNVFTGEIGIIALGVSMASRACGKISKAK